MKSHVSATQSGFYAQTTPDTTVRAKNPQGKRRVKIALLQHKVETLRRRLVLLTGKLCDTVDKIEYWKRYKVLFDDVLEQYHKAKVDLRIAKGEK